MAYKSVYPPKFSSTATYANRYDLDEIDVFIEGDSSNPMFFSINGLPDQLSYGKHYFNLSTLNTTNNYYELRAESRILFEFKSINNVILRSDVVDMNQLNGIATCYVDVLKDPLRTFKEVEDGEGTLTVVASLQDKGHGWTPPTIDNSNQNQLFPECYQEYNFNGDGHIDLLDIQAWILVGREDIADAITPMVESNIYPQSCGVGGAPQRPLTDFLPRAADGSLFPYFWEEFNYNGNGYIDLLDQQEWIAAGRPDIAQAITSMITEETDYPPKISNVAPMSTPRPISDFIPSPNAISNQEQIPIPDKFRGAMNYRCIFPIEVRKNLMNADSPMTINVEHKQETIKGQFSFAKAPISPLKTSKLGLNYDEITGAPTNPIVGTVEQDEGGSTS